MKISLFVFFTFLASSNLQAQEVALSLLKAIDLAQAQSAEAQAVATAYENSSWAYKSYKAEFLPSVMLNATIPNYSRQINAQTLDNGTQDFVTTNFATSNANVSISQNVGPTGGRIFFNTGLQRIDNPSSPLGTRYLSTPMSIGFRQEIFGFNEFKWLKQTEPLRYHAAARDYVESMEMVSINTVSRYFNYYDAIINLQLAKLNYANNDTLYQISKGRYQLGKIAEHELLQMELAYLTSRKNLRQAQIDLETARQQLANYLGLAADTEFSLEVPDEIDTFSIDPQVAVQKAMLYRSDVLNMQRQMIEAERNVARAKSNATPTVSLNASYGLSGSNQNLVDAYGNPLPQQQLTTGIAVPITTWGKNKADVKIAESNQALTEAEISMQKLRLTQEIMSQVNQFNFRQQEYYIAAKSDTIGQKRYKVAYQRYLIGKIDITDLNMALQDKDQSKRQYLNTLRRYWQDYYSIRMLTLYDFENNQSLIEQLEEEL